MTRDAEDLLVLARRGALSEADERRLAESLAESEELRFLDAAGRGFDADAPVLVGDEAQIERIAHRVARARRSSRRAVEWRKLAGPFAAGVLAAGVAFGAVEVTRAWLTDHQGKTEAPPPPAVKPAEPRSGVVSPKEATRPVVEIPEPASPAVVPSPSPSVGSTGRAGGTVERPTIDTGSAAPSPPGAASEALGSGSASARFDDPAPSPAAGTAAELFSAANRARVAGHRAEAIALYRRLRSEFPRSTEASASAVSLGVLYLQQKDAMSALEVFQASRALSGDHPSAETLWGLSQALRELGRGDEERAVLSELIARHPGSAYVAAARKRIAERK